MPWRWFNWRWLKNDPEIQLLVILDNPYGDGDETFYPNIQLYERDAKGCPNETFPSNIELYERVKNCDINCPFEYDDNPEEWGEIEVRSIPSIWGHSDSQDCEDFFNNLNDDQIERLAAKCIWLIDNDQDVSDWFGPIDDNDIVAPYLRKLHKFILKVKLPIIMRDYLYRDLIHELIKYL